MREGRLRRATCYALVIVGAPLVIGAVACAVVGLAILGLAEAEV